tara:strand:+ start:1297 stop:1485 length:189 start_codon:yes stop_codon:yes gene_type:complete
MKKAVFDKLRPSMKNKIITKWIKYYVGRGLDLKDAQNAAYYKAGKWKLSDRMRKVLDKVDEL